MSNEPRRHHYVPEFYLAGFTRSGSKDDHLYVLDQTVPKKFRAKPSEVAHKRDLYAVEMTDGDRMGVEKFFAELEGTAAPVIASILATKALPDVTEMTKLLDFIGAMSVRVPGAIRASNRPIEEIGKTLLREAVRTPEAWAQNVERLKDGGHAGDSVSYEEVKAFVEGDGYSIKTSQNSVVQTMLQSIDIVVPLLYKRAWSLLLAPQDGAHFICSDWPVSLEWTTPWEAWWRPGFGMPNTVLMFPLSKDAALLGSFTLLPSVSEASQLDVGKINSHTARKSRLIFSPSEDFIWYKQDGSIGRVADVIAAIKQMKEVAPKDDFGHGVV